MVPISINISRQHVFDSVFRDCIIDFSKEFHVPPELVVLELTESGFLEDNEKMYDHLRYLKEQGFALSMDDFGTGYSSLGLLKEAPADIVKIDKIFVRNIKENSFDSSFIRVVVELCHKAGIKVCLEGVEEDDEMNVVAEMDLDFIQGYLYGKPEEPENFYQLYLKEAAD